MGWACLPNFLNLETVGLACLPQAGVWVYKFKKLGGRGL